MTNLADLKELLDYSERFSASVWITVCGVAVGFTCLKLLYSNTKDDRPKWALPGAILAICLIVFAQGTRLWYQQGEPVVSPQAAFRALKENKRVHWIVRLIPYSSRTQSKLAIQELETLGNPDDLYVFVADYNEMRNLKVTDALFRSGLTVKGIDSVSAIIFPLQKNLPNESDVLVPANVRGLMQTIAKVDKLKGDEPGYKKYDLAAFLGQKEDKQDKPGSLILDNMKDATISSYSWDSYSHLYETYEKAFKDAQDTKASALRYIGKVEADWHPLGYSKIIVDDAKGTESFELKLPNSGIVQAPTFGARAFLFPNLKIQDMKRVVLIHFDTLETDTIPDLGGRSGTLSSL